MNAIEQKGYLYFQPAVAFIRTMHQDPFDRYIDDQPNPDVLVSYAENNWSKITDLISDGVFIKIAAERDGVRVEAKFNVVENVPDGNNGHYKISGGLFSGNGTFVNITRRERRDISFMAADNHDFIHFFICHSCSLKGKGEPFLRWRVVFRDFSNSDTPRICPESALSGRAASSKLTSAE